VFNSLGQTVATLVDGPMALGRHSVQFNGGQLASGMYLYRLEMRGQVLQKTMMLAK
jgi:hypothetical protein